jgi:hypothetical protein
MEFIRKNKAALAIVLIVLVLVLLRSTGVGHFKNNAKKWAEPSLSKSNTLSTEQAKSLHGAKLIVNIDKNELSESVINGEIRNIPADSVLIKQNIKFIIRHNGPVLLCSSDASLSARIWIILSQMGCKSIYILTPDSLNEAPKYEFTPDIMPAADLQ